MRIRAFTLAEVLITLGIIGVISALTIPTLIANTRSQYYRTSFKKSLSTLNQASRMAQAKYDVNYGLASSTCGANASTENLENTSSFCAILNGTLANYTFIGTPENYKIKMYKTDYTPNDMLAYTMSNGAMVLFSKAAAGCNRSISGANVPAQCLGYIDVNGMTKPNKIISCSNETDNFKRLQQCVIKTGKDFVTDVYPVIFYDGTVEPASAAARTALAPSTSKDGGVEKQTGEHNHTESTGTAASPGSDICDYDYNGIDPCSDNYQSGFDFSSLKNDLADKGIFVQQTTNY